MTVDVRKCFQDIWPGCLNLGECCRLFPASTPPDLHFLAIVPDACIRLHTCGMFRYCDMYPDQARYLVPSPAALIGASRLVMYFIFVSGGHDGSEYTPELILLNLDQLSSLCAG